ncbi:hypothetical protein ACNFU2_12255 [Chryseobacterium sp. PTM-20240506]|uniref:hypothetical protein n=1 Tax=Chryseobacterium sp. PTM-20240506 TaxID=3400631 RepID=UPI003AAD997D
MLYSYKKNFSYCLLLLSYLFHAQITNDSIPSPPIIQTEIDAGYRKILLSTIVTKKIDRQKKFNFLNITAVHSFYTKDDRRFDEVFSNMAVTYNYAGPFAAGAGMKFVNTTGITPFLTAQYSKRTPRLSAIILLSYMVINIPLREAIVMINYRYPINRDYQLFTQLLATTSWLDFKLHRRSQQQFRIGLDNKAFQYGLAIDFDQYDLNPVTKTNVGLFLRKEFR